MKTKHIAPPPYEPDRAPPDEHDPSRRRFVTAATLGAIGAASVSIAGLIDPLVRAGAWAAGSDKPEKDEVRIGFIPLTDCASVVIASVMN